ncbi:MAG UNVERIFIED_CONTAM: hypothetical protein LVT10_06740 [Anaerolineae bacterium]|jgi:hypothetical protein
MFKVEVINFGAWQNDAGYGPYFNLKISDPDWNKQKQQYPREVNRIQDIRRTLLMASFTLPFPPSMNTYWRNFRGRTIISKNGREFQRSSHSVRHRQQHS